MLRHAAGATAQEIALAPEPAPPLKRLVTAGEWVEADQQKPDLIPGCNSLQTEQTYARMRLFDSTKH